MIRHDALSLKTFNLTQSKQYLRLAALVFLLLLISANFVGNYSLRIFYFTYSAGTLLVQLVFCGIVALTETLGFKKTAHFVWLSTMINMIAALLIYHIFAYPIPEFWVKHAIDKITTWRQLSAILMLSIGYVCSGLAMVNLASFLKLYLKKRWLFLRVALINIVGLLVDTLVLIPILIFITPDLYLAIWKILSLFSVKISLSFIAIPLSYLLILVFKKKLFNIQLIH